MTMILQGYQCTTRQSLYATKISLLYQLPPGYHTKLSHQAITLNYHCTTRLSLNKHN